MCAHALDEPILTEAESVEELRAAVRGAVACHFDEADRPKIIGLYFVRDEVMTA